MVIFSEVQGTASLFSFFRTILYILAAVSCVGMWTSLNSSSVFQFLQSLLLVVLATPLQVACFFF